MALIKIQLSKHKEAKTLTCLKSLLRFRIKQTYRQISPTSPKSRRECFLSSFKRITELWDIYVCAHEDVPCVSFKSNPVIDFISCTHQDGHDCAMQCILIHQPICICKYWAKKTGIPTLRKKVCPVCVFHTLQCSVSTNVPSV